VTGRLAIGIVVRVLGFAAAAGACVLATSGLARLWTPVLLGIGWSGFGLAAVPGLELASGIGLIAAGIGVLGRVIGTGIPISRVAVLGMLLLVWALLAALAETLADEPPGRPVRSPVLAWAKQAALLTAVGLVGALACGLVAVVPWHLTGTVALVLAVVAPLLLLLALVFAWRWRESSPPRPGPERVDLR